MMRTNITMPESMEIMRRKADEVRAKEVLEAIRRGVDLMLEPGAVAELRILNTNRGTVSGYFNCQDKLSEAVAEWDGKAPGVYVTLNPVLPSLLSRSMNRVKPYVKHTTGDREILRRSWLPLDFDPVRPSGISSTDAEHQAALLRAQEVCAWLSEQGWPLPVVLDSGNGAGVLYRVDLANDALGTILIQQCLEALLFQFSEDGVDLDMKVGNAARLWKVPGTMACKGDPTPDRPHRRSEILQVPDKLEAVPLHLLEKLAALAPKKAKATTDPAGERLDVDAWLETHGMRVVSNGPWRDGRKWILNPCPWNNAHDNRAAYIVQFSNGAIAAGCHHNGCHGKGWHALRDVVEPGWRDRKTSRSVEIEEDEPASEQDHRIVMPEFPASAWGGMFGRWRELVGPVSEVHEPMHFLTFTTVSGLLFGRRVMFRYPHPHYPNFYAGFIGITGDAHKSTALRFSRQLAEDLGMALNVIYGVSSPEGLLERIGGWGTDQHGQRIPIPADPALLYLDEFGSLLAKVRMDATSGILPKLTHLYDCPARDENPTRGRPLVVLEPTLGLLTGTTKEVLERGLRNSDLTDGFLNRMIWVTGTGNPEPIPEPRPPDQADWNKLLLDLHAALDHWPPGSKEIPLEPATVETWDEIYTRWWTERQRSPASLILKATARTHTHIRKLALLSAALERKPTVDEPTIRWAAQLGQYFEDVTRWLLQDAILAPTRNVEVEHRIIRYLRDRANRPAKRSTREIAQALHHYAGSKEIKATLDGMKGIKVRYEDLVMPSGQKSDRWTVIS